MNQLDWEKEIVSPELKTQRGKINRLSRSLNILFIVEDLLKNTIKDSDEDYKKANSLRMYQYFLAKNIYYHHDFYNTEMKKDGYNPLKNFKDEHNLHNVGKSNLPLKHLREIEIIFRKDVIEKEKKKKAKDGGYDEIKEMFINEGLKPIKPKGLRKECDRDTIAIRNKGVKYHISIMKGKSEERLESVKTKAKLHPKFLLKYHKVTKEICDHLTTKGIENVWAMEGGGAQYQIFFGDKNGYIAILYLDMKNGEKLDWSLVPEKNSKLLEDYDNEKIRFSNVWNV